MHVRTHQRLHMPHSPDAITPIVPASCEGLCSAGAQSISGRYYCFRRGRAWTPTKVGYSVPPLLQNAGAAGTAAFPRCKSCPSMCSTLLNMSVPWELPAQHSALQLQSTGLASWMWLRIWAAMAAAGHPRGTRDAFLPGRNTRGWFFEWRFVSLKQQTVLIANNFFT